jgi:NADPH:quinone reductase
MRPVTPFLQKVGPDVTQRLKDRVAAALATTFASHDVREIALAQMLEPEVVAAYSRRSTGGKYLADPSRG